MSYNKPANRLLCRRFGFAAASCYCMHCKPIGKKHKPVRKTVRFAEVCRLSSNNEIIRNLKCPCGNCRQQRRQGRQQNAENVLPEEIKPEKEGQATSPRCQLHASGPHDEKKCTCGCSQEGKQNKKENKCRAVVSKPCQQDTKHPKNISHVVEVRLSNCIHSAEAPNRETRECKNHGSNKVKELELISQQYNISRLYRKHVTVCMPRKSCTVSVALHTSKTVLYCNISNNGDTWITICTDPESVDEGCK